MSRTSKNAAPPAIDPHTSAALPDFSGKTRQRISTEFPKSLQRDHLGIIVTKSTASGKEFASLAIEVDGKMVTTGENYLTSHSDRHVEGNDHWLLFQQAVSDLATEEGISKTGTLRIYSFHTHPTREAASTFVRSPNGVHEDGRPYTLTNDADWKSYQALFKVYVQELRKNGWTGPIEMVAGAVPAPSVASDSKSAPAKESYVAVTTLRVEAGQNSN